MEQISNLRIQELKTCLDILLEAHKEAEKERERVGSHEGKAKALDSRLRGIETAIGNLPLMLRA